MTGIVYFFNAVENDDDDDLVGVDIELLEVLETPDKPLERFIELFTRLVVDGDADHEARSVALLVVWIVLKDRK